MLPGGSLLALPGEVEEEMDRLEKLTRLRRLVEEAGGEIEGRKKLHKLVYLCQRANVDLDQSFVFHMYGVYSPSLALDLKSAIGWGLLQEMPQGDAFYIRLGDLRIDAAKTDDRDQPLDYSIAHSLAGESATVLEALSTIIYLYDNQYRGDDLRKKLESLKGHLRRDFPKAFALAEAHYNLRPEEIGWQDEAALVVAAPA